VVVNYCDSGSSNPTFGSNGIVIHDGAKSTGSDDSGYSITKDSNGKILVTGESPNSSGNNNMVIWRYIP